MGEGSQLYLLQEIIAGGTNQLHRWRRQACEGGKGRWAWGNAACKKGKELGWSGCHFSTERGKILDLQADFFPNLNFRNQVHVIEAHQTHGVSYFQLELAWKPLCFLLQMKGVGDRRGESEMPCDNKCLCGSSLMG